MSSHCIKRHLNSAEGENKKKSTPTHSSGKQPEKPFKLKIASLAKRSPKFVDAARSNDTNTYRGEIDRGRVALDYPLSAFFVARLNSYSFCFKSLSLM